MKVTISYTFQKSDEENHQEAERVQTMIEDMNGFKYEPEYGFKFSEKEQRFYEQYSKVMSRAYTPKLQFIFD